MYPLCEAYEEPILAFIRQVRAREGVYTRTHAMSTEIYGQSEVVFAALHDAMRYSWENFGKAVFVAKFLGTDLKDVVHDVN